MEKQDNLEIREPRLAPNEPLKPPTLIEALTEAASDSRVTAWFAKGGKRITFVDFSNPASWGIVRSDHLFLSSQETEDTATRKIVLVVRAGGYAGNQSFKGSGSYTFEDGQWIPEQRERATPRLPNIEDNELLTSYFSTEYQLTPEAVRTEVERKINIVPFTALPEAEQQKLTGILSRVADANDYITREIILKMRYDFREKAMPTTFPARLATWKEAMVTIGKISEHPEDYQLAFAGRDEALNITETSFVDNAESYVCGLRFHINEATTILREYYQLLAAGVGKLVADIPQETLLAQKDLLAQASSPDQCLAVLKKGAEDYEKISRTEIDIINQDIPIRLRMGKALSYGDLLELLETDSEIGDHYPNGYSASPVKARLIGFNLAGLTLSEAQERVGTVITFKEKILGSKVLRAEDLRSNLVALSEVCGDLNLASEGGKLTISQIIRNVLSPIERYSKSKDRKELAYYIEMMPVVLGIGKKLENGTLSFSQRALNRLIGTS